MSIDERVEQSKAKLEEWSSQEVRTTLDDYRKAQGGIDILRVPAVTLEGLAAVIGALSDGLRTLEHHNWTPDPFVTALVKAADAVTALLTTDVRVEDEDVSIGSPSKVMTTEAVKALYAEHIKAHEEYAEKFTSKMAEALHAEHSAGHLDLRSQSEAKRLQNLTQGSTIRIWPHENPDRVLLMDCRPDSPWKGKTLFEPVTALVQEASYALSGGYLAALYDSRAKEAK